MKIICVMVSSVDGKITKWGDPHISSWTSSEDKKHFSSVIEKANVIIMGRKTYTVAQSFIKNSPNKLRIIVTSAPEKYKDQTIPEQLEFTNYSPKTLVNNLEKRGYTEVLLAGGGKLNAAFFKAKLVDELWVTIEPRVFGIGQTMVGNEKLDVTFTLMTTNKLNRQGSLLLKYRVD